MNNRFFHARSRVIAILTLTALVLCAYLNTPVHAQDTVAPTTQTQFEAPKPPQVGEVAPDFELEAIDGEKVRLSAQTDKGPVVLIELRGFPGYQCPFCTKQVGELIAKAPEFAKSGAQVILVYPGPADALKAHADEFVGGKTMPANFQLLLDPDFAMTNSYGLRWNAQNETSYPSTFVLDGERKVLFAKISRSHGDRSTPEEILAALPK